MIIVDGHLDLAMNALQLNRDLLTCAHTIRSNELGTPGRGRACGAVALPELRLGRVALSLTSLFARCSGRPVPHRDFASPTQACAVARGQLAYYRALEQQGQARLLLDRGSLASHVDEWRAWDEEGGAGATPPLGFVVALEGADPLLRPESLEGWRADGLRVVALSHAAMGRYAGGAGSEVGLTPPGRRLLAEMASRDIALDLSHASDRTFDEALELHGGAVLASHGGCRRLVPHPRLLSDRQLRAIAERDGVAGISLARWHLRADAGGGGGARRRAGVADFVDHVDHVCQTTGSCRHVAVGSNLAATLDWDDLPAEIDTVADLQTIPAALAARGYSESDVAAVMHGNWLRLLGEALPA